MKLTDIPFVEDVVSIGPDSRVFDGLLISGPLIVGLIVLVGRNPITFALAVSYLILFVAGVIYRAVDARR
ncbi:MAG: hypothetical protein ABEJ08_02570 [Halobacteriaceae archaeon]